jgi:hypothetical protein
MTEEQILELAKTCEFDDFSPEDGVYWECWEEQLIEFARRVRRDTLFEAVSILQNVPNPQANITAINKILNHIEMELK